MRLISAILASVFVLNVTTTLPEDDDEDDGKKECPEDPPEDIK